MTLLLQSQNGYLQLLFSCLHGLLEQKRVWTYGLKWEEQECQECRERFRLQRRARLAG